MPGRQQPTTDRLSLRILGCHAFEIDTHWKAADVCSTYWRLYVNAADGAAIKTPAGTYSFSAERVHFVPPWVRFSCVCHTTVPHFYVHFDLIGLPATITRKIFPAPCALPPNPALEAAFTTLAAMVDSPSPGLAVHLRLKSAVWWALGELIDQLTSDESEQCRYLVHGDHPVQAALNYLENHLTEPVTNNQLAAQCNYSEDHFIRVFKDVVGETPARYVTERRIAYAAQQLLFTRDSIERIAEQTGFANRFHFSRVFARHLGETPASYRRATRV